MTGGEHTLHLSEEAFAFLCEYADQADGKLLIMDTRNDNGIYTVRYISYLTLYEFNDLMIRLNSLVDTI